MLGYDHNKDLILFDTEHYFRTLLYILNTTTIWKELWKLSAYVELLLDMYEILNIQDKPLHL